MTKTSIQEKKPRVKEVCIKINFIDGGENYTLRQEELRQL